MARRMNENKIKYPTEDLRLAERFSELLQKELGEFLSGVVVFGSSVRRESTAKSDIDVLVLTDDTRFAITEPLVEGYRIIVENVMMKVTPKLHVTSMTFTAFWEHVRSGDPVVVNILRDGVALHDRGFFEPLQILLQQGRIRPSEESIWRYYGRSPKTLLNSRWHVLQAALDLYWAVIDAAHAAIMRRGEVPPTPEHVGDILDMLYVKPRILEKKYVDTMKKFYMMSKKITHREIKEISGPEYEKLYLEADDFVRRMRVLIEKGKF